MWISRLSVCALMACGGGSSGDATATGTAGTAGTTAVTTGPTTGGPGGPGGTTELSVGTGTSAPATTAGETTSGGPQQDLVEVGHVREFRAAWVATVSN